MYSSDCFSWRPTLLILSLFAIIIASCASQGLRPDEAMAALHVRDAQQAGDATLIIEGTNPPPVGHHFLRFTEGEIVTGAIYLQVPPAACRPEGASCVSWRIRRPDGVTIGGDVPRGQTRVVVMVRDLLGSTTAELGHRGPFFALLTVLWVDDQGNDRTSVTEGIIDVRVVKNGYQSLHAIPTSRDFAWEWTSDGRVYRMTTALRAYAGAR